ncbi:uncharacterized protein LOC130049614 [Ostrea edulis]|uniref:uncharacterized protein LOC130049614 n=1 Tax=Ostrea edulis TaxID=37623 RepID=UPI0024AFE856|nr:uncharacterized protein LOC130049614 [Ostrea edulis]
MGGYPQVHVVLGIIFVVSVSAIMIVTWTKLIFDEETSKIVTLGVLIFCTSVGLLSAFGLLKFRSKTHGENKSGYRWSKATNNHPDNESANRGTGNSITNNHPGNEGARRGTGNSITNNHPGNEGASRGTGNPITNNHPDNEGASRGTGNPITNNHPDNERASRGTENPITNNHPDNEGASRGTGNPITNNHPDSESANRGTGNPITNNHPDNEGASRGTGNSITNNQHDNEGASKGTGNSITNNHPDNERASRGTGNPITNNQHDSERTSRCTSTEFGSGQIVLMMLIIFLSASLSAPSIKHFADHVGNDDDDNVSLNMSIYFEIYIWLSFVVKSVMLVCIGVCMRVSGNYSKYKFNAEGFILMFSFAANVFSHAFYSIAVLTIIITKEDMGLTLFICLLENIGSIILGGMQTVFLLATNNGEEMQNSGRRNMVYFACLLLFISNIGLWFSDSIGEAKLADLTVIIKKGYNKTFWIIDIRLLLPITIFFRIHSGMIFLKMYCNRNSQSDRISQGIQTETSQ